MSESGLPGERVTTGAFEYGGKMFIPKDLYRCAQCGELRGTATALTSGEADTEITLTCRCNWITCRRCGKGKIPKPGSNEVINGRVWHTPWFGAMVPCDECLAQQQRAEEQRLRLHPLLRPEYRKVLQYAYGLHPDQDLTPEECEVLSDKLMAAVGRPQYTRAELEVVLGEVIKYAEGSGKYGGTR